MSFPGFPVAGVAFLADLALHNDRAWFAAHKHLYQTTLLEPAQAFVLALGERLSAFMPDVHADPRTDGRGTLMRITRDTRFSRDKTPYKTNLSGLFWDGIGDKTASPAFDFRLQAEGMDLMAGMFLFPPKALSPFRAAVVDPAQGVALADILHTLSTLPGYQVHGERYQRVPTRYDANHLRADLLRYKGLAAHPPTIAVDVVCSSQLIDICVAHFQAMAPLQQWLAKACTPTPQ